MRGEQDRHVERRGRRMGGQRGLKHEEIESRNKRLMENPIRSQGGRGRGGVGVGGGAIEEEVLLGVCSTVHHHDRVGCFLSTCHSRLQNTTAPSPPKVFLGGSPFDSMVAKGSGSSGCGCGRGGRAFRKAAGGFPCPAGTVGRGPPGERTQSPPRGPGRSRV